MAMHIRRTHSSVEALHAALVLALMLALCWLPVAADDGGSPHGPALDNPDAQIVVTPAAPSVALGGTIRVNIYYTPDAAMDLYGLDISMSFDPTAVQILDGCPELYVPACPPGVQIVPGPLLVASGNQFSVYNIAHNTTGTVRYASAAMGGTPITNPGVLLYMDVQATSAAWTCINITESYLSTINGALIPHTRTSGCFNIYDPTAATISSFTASGGSNAVTLNWVTASEADNLGFNVYRAETADSARTRVNQALIPSLVNPGSLTGARYTYVDARIDKTRQAYYYWLESVDTRGHGELHGPVVATLPVPPLKLPPPLDPPDTK